MNKVFQTIVSKGRGDCERAALASMLELDIAKVPHFNLFGENWGVVYCNFIQSMGYNFWGTADANGHDITSTTVDGLVIAGVPSLTFEDVGHAVVVHAPSGVVVHDPNPNERWVGKNALTSMTSWALIDKMDVDETRLPIYNKNICGHKDTITGTLPNSKLQSTWCYNCCSVIKQGIKLPNEDVVCMWDTEDDILIDML